MDKKVRIQLFSKEGIPLSDRLVTQGPEFYSGPKEKHKGIAKIEFTFEDSKDVEDSIEYLNRLMLDLPIREVGKQGRKKKNTQDIKGSDFNAEKYVDDLLAESVTQDVFIKHLRKDGYRIVESDFLQSVLPEFQMKKLHGKNYHWLVRLSKVAKDPINDKYDPTLIVGVKLVGDTGRSDKMVIYELGDFTRSIKVELGKDGPKKIPIDHLKFPPYMVESDRLYFSKEYRALKNDPKREKTSRYKRWEKWVTFPDNAKI